MKKDIHPKYYEKVEVICACGNKFFVGSTKPTLSIEICSACHPYFTGTAKFIDKTGRVDRFKAKVAEYAKITKEKRRKEEEKERKRNEADLLLRTRRR